MTKRKKSDERGQPGRFAYDGLDRVLHEKARLGIMTSLVTRPEGLLFGELKRLCALTDGNLSRHLDVLHEAGLVEVWKGFENRRPQTLCRLSAEGRAAFPGVSRGARAGHPRRDAEGGTAQREGAGTAARAASRPEHGDESSDRAPAASSNTTRPVRRRSFFRCARALSSAAAEQRWRQDGP